MTSLEDILTQFEDFELAFIVKYKYDTYLDKSKKAIDLEIIKRKLSKDKMELLINKYEYLKVYDGVQRCPRCFSKKIAKDVVEYWNTYEDRAAIYDGLSGKQLFKEKLTCIVCDYIVYDPNSNRIIDFSIIFSKFKKIIKYKKYNR